MNMKLLIVAAAGLGLLSGASYAQTNGDTYGSVALSEMAAWQSSDRASTAKPGNSRGFTSKEQMERELMNRDIPGHWGSG